MNLPNIRLPKLQVDLAMLAAAVVEVPRWAVAFAAIREPMYAAVPMGLLLAWAASAGWRAYFEDRRRYLLLCINVASLLGALVVIAPVLYAMTYTPLQAVDLSQVLPPELLWAWAAVLAITTFIPLVQIAAVKAYQAQKATPTKKPTEMPTTHVAPIESAPTPVARPVGTLTPSGESPAAEQTGETGVLAPPVKLTPAQRRAQIAESGLQSSLQVQQLFNVGKRTADEDLAWVRKAAMQQNGVQHE